MSASTLKPPQIFDRDRIRDRLIRRSTGAPDFITSLVRDDLDQRLAAISRTFSKALIMGPDAAILPDKAQSAKGPFTFFRVGTLLAPEGTPIVDPENLHLPDDDYDLIVSVLDLQIINDVPGYLSRLHAHLAPDGLLLLATIGGSSLQELRSAWLAADTQYSQGAFARVAPFIDVRDAGALLQRAGFALPVTDIEQHVVRYGSPLELMQELRSLGATNPLLDRPGIPVTKALLAAACSAYSANAEDPDHRIRMTLEIVWMSGWSPHESQQKPLAPGSAQTSLKLQLSKTKSD